MTEGLRAVGFRPAVALALVVLAACAPAATSGGAAERRSAGAELPEFATPALPPTLLDSLGPDERAWVDETLASLSLPERVAQMVIEWIPGGYAAPGSPGFRPLAEWVDDGIGGFSPSIGTPHAYAAKLNALQERARVPLLIGADFESGGPGMRLAGTYALPSMLEQGGGTDFPPTMAFGAIADERFAYEYGRITATEARAVGVHQLYAPVLDVNSNADNPVINARSFGGDADLVARMGAAFIRGARDGGALTTAKHFPGHGDTSTDSHVELPVVGADRARLDALELVPFRRAIDEGVDAVMTAHVALPEVLHTDEPATLRPEIMTAMLRDDLGFEGVLFTDALSMRAVSDRYGIGEAAVRALEAGADVLLSPHDVDAAVDAVVAAVESGRVSRERVDASVRRLLEAKARVGLNRSRTVDLEQVDHLVGTGAHLAFADTAASRSMTLVRDRDGLVPLDPRAAGRVAHVVYAPAARLWADRTFGAALAARMPTVTTVRLDEDSDAVDYARAMDALAAADRVVVSVYIGAGAGASPDVAPARLRGLVGHAAAYLPTTVVSFGNAYLLEAFPAVGSYLLAWGDRPVSQRAAARALLGERPISGRLPVELPGFHPLGWGLDRAVRAAAADPAAEVPDPLAAVGVGARRGPAPGAAAQSVADPASVGMDARRLARIDALVRAALADSAASGVAVAVGRHGRLVTLEGWGELAYGSGRPATPTSIWDMASISKVAGTTTMAMRLVAEGRMSLDDPVVRWLPWWSRGDARKEQVTVRQLLTHTAGFTPFRRWFVDHSGVQSYKDAVADEPLEVDPGTRTAYSDIGIMSMAWVLEAVSGQSLDGYLESNVWGPLGMEDTGYLPDASVRYRIAATELDTTWRHRMVWGTVHDENAEAMGGVAGHAGLFSTAVDLSVFAAMMLNGGAAPACEPGSVPGLPCPVARPSDVHVVDPGILDRWTRRVDASSTRAIGWDTPGERSSGGDYVTPRAFGHTGYTGTSLWMDPELDLWVLVLTNRVHPTRENSKHVALRRAIADAAATAITDRPVFRREGGS